MVLKNKVFVVIALCMIALPITDAHSEKIVETPTEVCFRRIESVSNNIKYSNYEIVMNKSSGKIERDIFRLRQFGVNNGPMKSPHIKPFIWIGAFLYDKRFDGLHGPDCSKLPDLKSK